jgi:uncharacterized protein (DUF58 family)
MAGNQKRTLPVRVSGSGSVFALVSLLVLLAAVNTGENLFYLIFGAFITLMFLSFVVAWWNLRRLHVTRETPDAVHRGAQASLHIEVKNNRLLMPAVSIRLESASRPKESAGYLFKVPAGQTGVLNVREVFDRRGVYPVPAISLLTTFPFGLVHWRRRIKDDALITVYPRVHAVRTATLEQSQNSGDTSKNARGPGDEFHSLREYVVGDDMRHIAWRVSARLGSLVVRELEQETSRYIVFVLDTSPYPDLDDYAERFEEAVELVASLAVTMLTRQYTVSVVTGTDALPEGEGKAQVVNVLEMLARVQPDAESGGDALGRVGTVDDTKRAACFYVSPSPSQWGRKKARGGVHVLDPREVIHA